MWWLAQNPLTSWDNLQQFKWPYQSSCAKSHDVLIIHNEINKFRDSISTIKKAKTIVTAIKEINIDNSIQTDFSGVVHGEDHTF